MTRKGVVAQAFGVPDSIRSNERIAWMAGRKALQLEAPVYTQRDVRIDDGIEVEYTPEEPGNPPPTLRIVRGAVAWAIRLGIGELWLACAKPHLWRCKRDLEYAIREAGVRITVRVCEYVERYPEHEWYCADSTQPRVRSEKEWRRRERIIEWMPMFIYKRVAS
ncbi:MAG: hypothetical protein WDN47_01730 [Candidatus Doudnabacteria bacterium]